VPGLLAGIELGQRRRARLSQERRLAEELALRRAAEARQQAEHESRMEAARTAQTRQEYLDRLKTSSAELSPFPRLLEQMPGAGASPYVGRAVELTDLIARDPTLAGRRPDEPAMQRWTSSTGETFAPEGPPQPSYGDERRANIDQAYSQFGAEKDRRAAIEAALRAQVAGAGRSLRSPTAKTTDLDIAARALSRKQAMLEELTTKGIQGPNGEWQAIAQITDPNVRVRLQQQIERLQREIAVEVPQLRAAYQQRLGLGSGALTFPAAPDPMAYYERRLVEGADADTIAEELGRMGYTEDQLRAAGFELED
jgi:hypothetical protein